MVIKKRIEIRNPQGLHARPASIFVKIANKFEADVFVTKDGETVDGKSIMGLMTLAANQGSMVDIHVSGPDAQQMMGELETFLLREREDETPPKGGSR